MIASPPRTEYRLPTLPPAEAELLSPAGIARWREYLEYELRRRPATLSAYMSALRKFAQFYEESDFPTLRGREARRTLRNYLQWLSRPPRRYDTATIHAYFRALSSWMEWQIVEEIRESNPVRGLKLPDLGEPSRDLFNRDQVRALFAAADRIGAPWDPYQVRAILALLVGNALRAGEVKLITVRDLDLSEMRLVIRNSQKNKQQSILPVVRPFDAYHRAWLARRAELLAAAPRRRELATEQYACFGPHRQLGEEGVYTLLHRLLDLAGLRRQLPGITPHACRHFAIDVWNQVAGLEEARRLARHSSPVTTSRYVHPTSPRLRAIAGAVGSELFPEWAAPTPEELFWRGLQPSLPFQWE